MSLTTRIDKSTAPAKTCSLTCGWGVARLKAAIQAMDFRPGSGADSKHSWCYRGDFQRRHRGKRRAWTGLLAYNTALKVRSGVRPGSGANTPIIVPCDNTLVAGSSCPQHLGTPSVTVWVPRLTFLPVCLSLAEAFNSPRLADLWHLSVHYQ